MAVQFIKSFFQQLQHLLSKTESIRQTSLDLLDIGVKL